VPRELEDPGERVAHGGTAAVAHVEGPVGFAETNSM